MGLTEQVREIFTKGSEAPASGVDSVSSGDDTAAVREEIQASGRKRRSDAGQPRGKRRVAMGDGESPAYTQEEVDALFQGENWEGLAAIPFETRYVMTGWEGFRLTNDERTRMGKTTAMTMRLLLKIDPKYIALAVWGTMYFGTWAAKEGAFAKLKKDAISEQQRKQKERAA